MPVRARARRMGTVFGPKPFVHRPTKVLGPRALVGETTKTSIHTEARGGKYETNPIPSKPIAINELRFVLRPPPFLSALGHRKRPSGA